MRLECHAMKGREDQKDELLRIAADVVAGERDPTDLEKHGIGLGDPIAGDAAKQMLLAELAEADEADRAWAEQILLAEEYWAKLAVEGLKLTTLTRKRSSSAGFKTSAFHASSSNSFVRSCAACSFSAAKRTSTLAFVPSLN